MPVGHAEVCVGLRYRLALCLVAVQQLGGRFVVQDGCKLPSQVVCVLRQCLMMSVYSNKKALTWLASLYASPCLNY